MQWEGPQVCRSLRGRQGKATVSLFIGYVNRSRSLDLPKWLPHWPMGTIPPSWCDAGHEALDVQGPAHSQLAVRGGLVRWGEHTRHRSQEPRLQELDRGSSPGFTS